VRIVEVPEIRANRSFSETRAKTGAHM